MERYDLNDWELLSQVSQVFRVASDSYINQIDVPRGQATLLCALAKKDGMTQSEIADQLSVQGATVSNMLYKLEEAGLVTRRRDPDDNRLVHVYLTDKGRDIEQSLNVKFAELQELIFKGIGGEELALLRKNLEQIVANIS